MQAKQNSDQGSSAATPARAPNASVAHVLSQAATPQQFCTALAKLFGVRPTEVALMRLEKGLLSFLFPEQLKTAGSIPVSSSSAIAAHTSTTRARRESFIHPAVCEVKAIASRLPINPLFGSWKQLADYALSCRNIADLQH
jgi:hypothetical protein